MPRDVLGVALGAEVARSYRRCVWRHRPISYKESLSLPGGMRVWQPHLSPVSAEKAPHGGDHSRVGIFDAR